MRAGCTNKYDRNCYRAWKSVADYESNSWIVKQNNYNGPIVTGGGVTTFKMRFQVLCTLFFNYLLNSFWVNSGIFTLNFSAIRRT
jgi:hypothetical protein